MGGEASPMVANVMLLVGVKTSSRREKHLKAHSGKSVSSNNSLAAWNVLNVDHMAGVSGAEAAQARLALEEASPEQSRLSTPLALVVQHHGHLHSICFSSGGSVEGVGARP